ncbi:HMG-box (high mobility group) DNA-binding family protein [Wolffia australiana]
MGNPRLTKKRVRAVRRAPDGSSFQICPQCGESVAILLLDMHECGGNEKKRRLEREVVNFVDQPRSAFCFFTESLMKNCEAKDWAEIGREAFEKWVNMSAEERLPFVEQADSVNSAYLKTILEECRSIAQVEDEADSAMVGLKVDLQRIMEHEDTSYQDSGQSFYFESFASDSEFPSRGVTRN